MAFIFAIKGLEPHQCYLSLFMKKEIDTEKTDMVGWASSKLEVTQQAGVRARIQNQHFRHQDLCVFLRREAEKAFPDSVALQTPKWLDCHLTR